MFSTVRGVTLDEEGGHKLAGSSWREGGEEKLKNMGGRPIHRVAKTIFCDPPPLEKERDDFISSGEREREDSESPS